MLQVSVSAQVAVAEGKTSRNQAAVANALRLKKTSNGRSMAKNWRKIAWIVTALWLGATSVRGQWVEERIPLLAGWNGVYLHVDLSHTSLEALIGADANNPIEEIWVWVPEGPGVQYLRDAQTGGVRSQWLKWDRNDPSNNSIERLPGNVACLVRVREAVGNYEWRVTGRPLVPQAGWTSNGLNLIGFPVVRSAPNWAQFTAGAGAGAFNPEVYRYVGGPLSATNPQRVGLLRAVPVARTGAYWVRTEDFNRYAGPIAVAVQGREGLQFGDRLERYRMRVRNVSDQPIEIELGMRASAAAPAGQTAIAGIAPLLLRGERSADGLTFGFHRLHTGTQRISLTAGGQPGSEVELVLGLERPLMVGAPGTLYAGILEMRDSTGLMQIEIGVSGSVASRDGLWVGNAVVDQVGHYLVDYATTPAGQLAQNEGAYIVDSVDTSLGAVARPYPLRMIVHQGPAGAKLLQKIFIGSHSAETLVLTEDEAVLDSSLLAGARRISVTHLPEGGGWPLDGPLADGQVAEVVVNIDYNDHGSNPFVHSFHPDHDNLNAFYDAPVPQGVESFGIRRTLRFEVQGAGTDFDSLTETATRLGGVYSETLSLLGRGTHERAFEARGIFQFRRLSEIANLTE